MVPALAGKFDERGPPIMANASVDKLKALGLRHGEKAVVGLTAALFVAFVAMAVMRETLDMQPAELASKANNASANLVKQQAVPDILAKLEKDGLTDPKFVSIVDNQLKNALNPDVYKPKLEWVTPEPGAGLIRDTPELIAPTDLAAFPGRGGILMYALDDSTPRQRIIDTGEDPKKKGRAKKAEKGEKPEDKKRREEEEEKRKKQFAGKVEDAAKDKDKKDDGTPDAVNGPYKEETRGMRWVVVTAVIDQEQLKKNYLMALKNPAVAYPNYKRVSIQRRQRLSEGGWSEWDKVDRDKCYDVLDNLPQLSTEFVPVARRPEALVDYLPFLKAGYWTGVHVAKLVPPEILEGPKKKATPPGGGGGGRMGGPGSNSGMAGSMSGPPGDGAGGMSLGGGNSGMAGSMGGPGAGAGADGADAGVVKNDEKSLMIRLFDFTVDPDATYQFRLRIVVVNPNLDHTDVNPGVDVVSTELLGPWSEPTDPVTIPADVAAYAQAPEPATRRDDLVMFQVIKWDAKTGQTVIKNDGAAPGELIGVFGSTQVPTSDGSGPKPDNIDFNSRSIVLDTFGGSHKLPDIGLDRNQFIIPALAMVVEPDGSVVIRDQAEDKIDDVRDDMESNYKQALADSSKTREAGSDSRMMGAGGDPRQNASKKKKKKR
jgi:hypothetical protein